MRETLGYIRDRQRRVRGIVDSVRADLRGESRAGIAVELARRLAVAGLPELPENVDQKAALIADPPRALVSLTIALVRVVAGHPSTAGLRRECRRLDGTVWTTLPETNDPLTQRTLRIYDAMLPSDAPETYIGRIVALPDGEVAVFLGGTFIGVLPPELAHAVRAIAVETDAADQKLMVKGRIVGAGDIRKLAVALL